MDLAMHNSRIRRSRGRAGISLVWMTIGFTALISMASLAVDFGHVQLAKRQLQDAADAAALAAAGNLSTGVTATQTAAVDYGANNKCDGTAVTIDPNADLEFLDY